MSGPIYLRKSDEARAAMSDVLDELCLVEGDVYRQSARVAWYLIGLLTYTAPQDVLDAIHDYRVNGGVA